MDPLLLLEQLHSFFATPEGSIMGQAIQHMMSETKDMNALLQEGIEKVINSELTPGECNTLVTSMRLCLSPTGTPPSPELQTQAIRLTCNFTDFALTQGCDMFQAFQYFYRTMILLDITASLEGTEPGRELVLNMACAYSAASLWRTLFIDTQIWNINQSSTQGLLQDLRDLAFEYMKENPAFSYFLCLDLLRAYTVIGRGFSQKQKTRIRGDLILLLAKCCYQAGQYRLCTRHCKEACELFDCGSYIPYELWARALHKNGQYRAALDKVECAKDCIQEEKIKQHLQKYMDQLRQEMLTSTQQPTMEPDADWLTGTNISTTQLQQARAQQAKNAHVKKKRQSRPRREHVEPIQVSHTDWLKGGPMQKGEPGYRTSNGLSLPFAGQAGKDPSQLNVDSNPLLQYTAWDTSSGDDGSDLEDAFELRGSPSSQHEEKEPEVTKVKAEKSDKTWFEESKEMYDNGDVDTKITCGMGMDVETESIEAKQYQQTRAPFYRPLEPNFELRRLMAAMPEKYKQCKIQFEASHKAVCKVLSGGETYTDIEIHGRSKCGQTFNNDEVCVEVLSEPHSHPVSGHVIYKRAEEDDKVYGRVVGALNSNFREESHTVMACTCDDDEGFLMHPLCKTVPKIHALNGVTKKKFPSLSKYRIDTYEINENGQLRYKKYFDVKPGLRGRYVFLVVYLTWGIHHVYPLGAVVDIIECGTDFNGGLKILEMQYQVPTYFSQDTVAHIGKILKKRDTVLADDRVDCTGLEVFTIDPAHSKDLDDALSISAKDDYYLIGVHIADVASVVKKGDPVDREAQKRATSFYPCESRAHNMLPEPLSEGMCSLLPNEKRHALSIFFHIEKSGKLVKEPTVMKTKIKSSCKLSYEDAQKVIENEEVDHVSQTLKDNIKLLHEIAQNLRKDRLKDSRFAVPFEDPRFIETEIIEQNIEAHSLIEEFMIKANTSIAQWLRKKFPNSIPIRCQSPPSTEDVQKFVQSEDKFLDLVVNMQGREVLPGRAVASGNWVAKGNTVRKELLPVQKNIWLQILDGVHDETLTKAVRNMCKDEVHPFQAIALQHWRQIMESAEYKCSMLSEKELNHFSLNTKMYTHFTSPIRRYVDLIVQRLVHAALDGKSCPYSSSEIADICAYINDATSRQKHFSNGCQALKRAAKISQRPMVFNAVVDKVSDSGAELCIPSLKHVSSRSKELPFNLMDFSKKPEEKQDPWSTKTIVTGKWKKRLYDCTGCPSQLMYSKMLEKQQGFKQKQRPKQVVSIVNPNQHVYFVDTQTWAKMLNALFSQDHKALKKMVNSQPREGQDLPTGAPVRDMVTSEHGDGSIKFHHCKFTLCFTPGRVIKVQMVANPEKGLLTPQVRLFQVCKNLSLCLSHMEDPVGVLSKYATESTKKNIESISEYQRTWLPLLEMESATSAVRSEENIIINNVNIEFKRNQGKTKTFYKGTFTFPSSFVHERCIEFGGKPLEKLKEEGDDDDDERDNFGRREFSSIDYLCIRIKIDQNRPESRETYDEEISNKVIEVPCPLTKEGRQTKSSKRSKSSERRRSRRKAEAVECALKKRKVSEGCGADVCSQADTYTWVGHAQIMKVRRKKDKDMESDYVTVTFSLNANSGPVPDELFPKSTGTVEVIFKSEVDRRTMRMIQSLSGDKLDLASCVALHRRPPKLDKDRLDYGKKMEKEVPVQGLPLNNTKQHEAIDRALSSSFTLIQGPPGTGKTYTGIKLVYLFNKINKFLHLEGVDDQKKQVLFCGPSNKAVDLVAFLLLCRLGDACPNIIRLYGSNIVAQDYPVPKRNFMSKRSMRGLRSDPRLFDVSLHHMIRQSGKPHAEEIRMYDALFKTNPEAVTPGHIKKYGKLVYMASCEELKKCDVILCTCPVGGNRKVVQSTRIFQLIIDESAMSPEPQSMIPIIATKAKQVVLIGDHKQLRPIVQCKQAAELGLDQSLFERFATEATFLNTQYRMHPRLCDFPSEEFYDGKLTTGPSWTWKCEPLAVWPVPEVPHVLCHVEGVEDSLSVSTEEGNEQSKSNKAEVDKVVEVFSWLVQKGGISPRYINIMSQYNAQCTKIREALSKYHHQSLNVNTVVASQGGEWDYVIFSTVRSLPHYKIEKNPTLGWSKHNLGFITDANQVNVALTRSRRGLIIIGNENLLRSDKIFKRLIEKYEKQGCLVDGSDFPRRYRRDHQKRRPPIPGLEWKTA
ncbi:helicase with zinc finger domain 2-like isoform X1 [Haliotis rufescens]|uniref:helicase with zinc finger domain 2-like isoform X1 n=2 Tax=Haliotis rufescens TaxID=6454 RepID=UPI00201EA2A1|nr:helicase with zinc finger domain 2-like isoform X1 [Haliotis rufescens]